MKPFFNYFLCLVLAVTFVCPPAKAQSGFFVSTNVSAGNVYTDFVLTLASLGVNLLINKDDEDAFDFASSFYYDYKRFKEDGKRMKSPDQFPDQFKSIYGFRAVDLFSHLKGDIKFGWMGAYSPIGIYAKAGIRHQNFAMQLAKESEASRYMVGTFCPGFGIRVAPGNLFDWDMYEGPFVEFGTNYNKSIYYQGPYNNDKGVFNDGLSYMLSVGLSPEDENISAQIGIEWFPFDMFNTGYVSSASGQQPFANLSSKMYSFFLTFSHAF